MRTNHEGGRRKNLSEFELEDKVKADVIRSRAIEKMAEEEDEIKKLNKVRGTFERVISNQLSC